MSNNLKQKNIIYKLDNKDNLAYSSTNNTVNGNTVGNSSAPIIAQSFNNTFQQLIDNDLIVEKMISEISANNIGPKSSENVNVESAPDGYKFVDSSDINQYSVCRKYIQPVSESIEPSDDLFDMQVYFVTNMNGRIVVGTETGLYIKTNDTFKQITIDVIDGQVCKSWCKAGDDFIIAFETSICRLVLGDDSEAIDNNEDYYDAYVPDYGDESIIEVNDTTERTGSYLQLISEMEFPTINNISYNGNDNTIYVGTKRGVFTGKYYAGIKNIIFNQSIIRDNNIVFDETSVNDAIVFAHTTDITDGNDTIIATDDGIFRSGLTKDAINARMCISGLNCTFIANVDDNIFAGLQAGGLVTIPDGSKYRFDVNGKSTVISGYIDCLVSKDNYLYASNDNVIYKIDVASNTAVAFKTYHKAKHICPITVNDEDILLWSDDANTIFSTYEKHKASIVTEYVGIPFTTGGDTKVLNIYNGDCISSVIDFHVDTLETKLIDHFDKAELTNGADFSGKKVKDLITTTNGNVYVIKDKAINDSNNDIFELSRLDGYIHSYYQDDKFDEGVQYVKCIINDKGKLRLFDRDMFEMENSISNVTCIGETNNFILVSRGGRVVDAISKSTLQTECSLELPYSVSAMCGDDDGTMAFVLNGGKLDGITERYDVSNVQSISGYNVVDLKILHTADQSGEQSDDVEVLVTATDSVIRCTCISTDHSEGSESDTYIIQSCDTQCQVNSIYTNGTNIFASTNDGLKIFDVSIFGGVLSANLGETEFSGQTINSYTETDNGTRFIATDLSLLYTTESYSKYITAVGDIKSFSQEAVDDIKLYATVQDSGTQTSVIIYTDNQICAVTCVTGTEYQTVDLIGCDDIIYSFYNTSTGLYAKKIYDGTTVYDGDQITISESPVDSFSIYNLDSTGITLVVADLSSINKYTLTLEGSVDKETVTSGVQTKCARVMTNDQMSCVWYIDDGTLHRASSQEDTTSFAELSGLDQIEFISDEDCGQLILRKDSQVSTIQISSNGDPVMDSLKVELDNVVKLDGVYAYCNIDGESHIYDIPAGVNEIENVIGKDKPIVCVRPGVFVDNRSIYTLSEETFKPLINGRFIQIESFGKTVYALQEDNNLFEITVDGTVEKNNIYSGVHRFRTNIYNGECQIDIIDKSGNIIKNINTGSEEFVQNIGSVDVINCMVTEAVCESSTAYTIYGLDTGCYAVCITDGIKYLDVVNPHLYVTSLTLSQNRDIKDIRKFDRTTYVRKTRAIYQVKDGDLQQMISTTNVVQDFCIVSGILFVKTDSNWYYVLDDSLVYVSVGAGTPNRSANIRGVDFVCTDDGLKKIVYKNRKDIKISDAISISLGGNIVDVYAYDDTIDCMCVVNDTSNKQQRLSHVYINTTFGNREISYIDQQFTKTQYIDDTIYKMFDGITMSVNGNIDDFVIIKDGDQYYTATNLNDDIWIRQRYVDTRLESGGRHVNSVYKGDHIYIGTTGGVLISDGSGYVTRFDAISSNSGINATTCNSLLCVSDTKYAVATSDGIYTIANTGRPLSSSIYKNSLNKNNVDIIRSWSDDGVATTYGYTSGGSILTSDNFKRWSDFVTIVRYGGESVPMQAIGTIHDIHVENRFDYYFATDNGLYTTKQQYELVQDIDRLTMEKARDIFEEHTTDLQDLTYEALAKHEDDYHYSGDDVSRCLIPVLNSQYMASNFDGLENSDFGQTDTGDGIVQTGSDMVYEFIYGNSGADSEVHISYENFLTTSTNAQCSYILKRFMSGITELYVYIPTTQTYYLNHIEGTPNCMFAQAELTRKNIKGFGVQKAQTDSTISKHYTKYTVRVDETLMFANNVICIEATGNSLPLKIYMDKDASETEDQASMLFHSFIEPTQCLTDITSIKQNSAGEYIFEFACFGSDAQAVKITCYDPDNKNGTSVVTVKFHGNGAEGDMSSQKFILGRSRNLRQNAYVWSKQNKTFYGWTTMPNPKDNQMSGLPNLYKDGANFSPDQIGATAGQVINLYAVWIDGTLNADDNIITLMDTVDELYIDGGEIDSNSGTATIDYGE